MKIVNLQLSLFHLVLEIFRLMWYSNEMIYDVRGAPKSNFSFELAKSMKICSTSSNLKMFGTEEKTKNVDLEIKRSGN